MPSTFYIIKNLTMVMRIRVFAEEQRKAADGDGFTGVLNNPWKKITPDGLEGNSMISIPEDLPSSIVDTVKAQVTSDVCRELSWFFKINPDGKEPVIVDVLRDQKKSYKPYWSGNIMK